MEQSDVAPDADTIQDSEPARESLPESLMAMWVALDEHLDALDGLEELKRELAPHVADLDDLEHMFEAFSKAVRTLTNEQVAVLDEAVSATADENGAIDILQGLRTLRESHPDEYWVGTVFTGFARTLARPRRQDLMLRSLLTSAVGSFEVLFAAVARHYYSSYPGSLSSQTDQKEFSLSDLLTLSSIEDARDVAIDRRVEGILFEGFAAWSKWASKHLGFGFEEICLDWSTLREVVERRHVIVHNGGRASRRYLANTGALGGPVPDADDYLVTDDDYLRAAFLELRVVGTLLAVLAAIKLDAKTASHSVHELHRHIYDLLLSEHWSAAEALAEAGLKLKVEQNDRLTFQFNSWLCKRRLGISCEDDIRSLDASALADRFQLVRLALLDDVEPAMALLEHCVETDTVGLEALLEWPVLDSLRSSSVFRRLVEEHFAQLVERQQASKVQFAEVYFLPGADKFHGRGCRHAGAGRIGVPRRTAAAMGLRPCGVCGETPAAK